MIEILYDDETPGMGDIMALCDAEDVRRLDDAAIRSGRVLTRPRAAAVHAGHLFDVYGRRVMEGIAARCAAASSRVSTGRG